MLKVLSQTKEPIILETTIVSTDESLVVFYVNPRVLSNHIRFTGINTDGRCIVSINVNTEKYAVTAVKFMKRVPMDTVKEFCLNCIQMLNGKKTNKNCKFSDEFDKLLTERREHSNMILDQYKDKEFILIVEPEVLKKLMAEL